MPLANFPVKPRTPNHTEFKLPPRQAKRERRSARIYEPKSPYLTRPEAAYIMERPTPILSLPGLPPSPVMISLPPDVQKTDRSIPRDLAKKMIKSSKAWLGQIKVPFAKDPLTPKIPPTPKTAEWIFEEIPHNPRTKADWFKKVPVYKRQRSDGFQEWKQDPPPLYTKDPEEGGVKAWMTVAGAFLVQFCTFGYLFTWNVFEDHYTHQFLTDQSPIAVRYIGIIQWFLVFFLALVGGKLVDLGFFHYTVIGGSALFTSSLFLLSVAGEERLGHVFACQSLGMGIGVGLVFVPTAIVAARYFKRMRGLAIGIAMSGGPFGGMIFPAALRASVLARGFPVSVRTMAVVILIFLLIGNCLMIYMPKEPKEPKEPKSTLPRPRLDISKYSREVEYVAIAAGSFLSLMFIYCPLNSLELLGLDRGVDSRTSFNTIIVLSLTSIIGSVGLGFASDKVGVWNLLMFVNGLLALLMFGMGSIRSGSNLMGLAFFYGIFLGSWIPLTVIAIMSLETRTDDFGTRVGLVFSFGSFGYLFADFIESSVLGPGFRWGLLSAISGMAFLGVFALAIVSRMAVSYRTLRRKKKFLAKIQYLEII